MRSRQITGVGWGQLKRKLDHSAINMLPSACGVVLVAGTGGELSEQ